MLQAFKSSYIWNCKRKFKIAYNNELIMKNNVKLLHQARETITSLYIIPNT